ncbi:TetR/AcrR family transcriptional regulator [Gordonia sp. w5E2]|uniref:TetR family transcriptional regulator n=1 Tax=Gordonia jacobaea TaxID=122202 RepID=A0ABR5IFP3_9ACTN|nr:MULTISPECIES: TetR/AcrR family transcriptional regulator [Gordonia]KNA92394.1 TetR family transcriptional regulator [Gordonia jacobaea]
MSVSTSPTREQLLRTAERLFLTDGYDAVSVRAICAGAGANPAAVHYHFGSKDQLATALLEARLTPLWADQLMSIDTSRASVAALVDVVISPFVEIQHDPAGHLHLQLLARFVHANPEAPWHGAWFDLDRWADMLVAMVGALGHDQARRRWALAFELILSRFSAERPLSDDAVTSLTEFVVAGLGQPCTPATVTNPAAVSS